MSSRPLIKPFDVISDGDMSSQIISEVTIITNLSMISYDVSWNGTGVDGAFDVQVSNTYEEDGQGNVKNAGNWTSLTLSSATNATTDTGNGFIDVTITAATAIRLVYTPNAGTGVLNAKCSAKVA